MRNGDAAVRTQMRLFRRKCAFLLDVFALTALFCLSVLVVHTFWSRHPRGGLAGGKDELSFLASLSLGTAATGGQDERLGKSWKLGTAVRAAQPLDVSPRLRTERGAGPSSRSSLDPSSCTMGRCFDESTCRGGFRVYVYPDTEGLKVSGLYRKFLRILRSSQYYTSDPDKACVLVPSWDTLDRDKLSDEYVTKLPSPWSLPHWNGGKNHLFFNLYSGSWPIYEENLDFDTGQAMVAKASFNMKSFREKFDISFPLIHSSHPERGTFPSVLTTEGNLLPPKRKYHLAFKGKRYLYGLGVEPRRSLYHIHNSRDVVMVMTCRHNKNWEKYQDSRCGSDNTLYDRSVNWQPHYTENILGIRFLPTCSAVTAAEDASVS